MDVSADTTCTPGAQSGAAAHGSRTSEISHTLPADAAGQPADAACNPADTLKRVGNALFSVLDHEAIDLTGAANAAARLGFLLEEELPQAKGLCWLTAHVVERVEELIAALDEVRDLMGRRPLAVVMQEAEERRQRHERGAADFAAAASDLAAA